MQQTSELIDELSQLFGEDRVVHDDASLRQPEAVLLRQFERAFDYTWEHLPICILKVHTTQEVALALKYCNDNGINVITRTGASSSEDQLLVINDNTIVLDCIGLNEVFSIDAENMLATVGCGVKLEDLERLANEKGLTTGHWPQSQPLACMGGLVATRSIGQFSTYYGGIEDMLCGLEAVMPDGEIVRIRNVPRAASGPDLRHIFMGSEGTIGVITEVTVKLFTYYPDDWWKGAYVVPNFEAGIDAIREIIVKGFKPAIVRLYDKADIDANYPGVSVPEGHAFMFFVAEGPPSITRAIGEAIDAIALARGATVAPLDGVDLWLEERNKVCYVLGTPAMLDHYRATEIFYTTCEVSASWSDIKRIYKNVTSVLPKKIDNLILVGGHVSHSYQTGTNIYFVYKLRAGDPRKMNADDLKVKDAIATEVLKEPSGGIVHHHGVGKMRVSRIKDELGSSYGILSRLKHEFDPNGIMNQGTLIPQEK